MKGYLRQLEFFAHVDFAWIALLFDGLGDPVTDESFLKSLGYTGLSLALWLGLLVGSGWAAGTYAGFWAALATILVFGLAIAPVLVVALMKGAFPGISGRLQRQIDVANQKAGAKRAYAKAYRPAP